MAAEVWGCVVASRKAARLLGDEPYVVQVRAFALARSRAAFARALIAAGLDSRSVAAVSNYISDYGGPSGNPVEVATATVEGEVYVSSMNGKRGAPLRWPGEGRTDG